MKFLLASLLLGIVSACGFAPWSLWPLTLAAFASLFWLIETAPSLRSALARGYWFGVGQFTLGLNWIATAFTFQDSMPHWLGWIAVVLLSLYLAVYPAMATGLAWRWGNLPLPLAGEGRGEGVSETAPHPRPLRGSSLSRLRERGLLLVLVLAAAWIVTEWLRATVFTGFAWNPVGVAMLPTMISRAATLVGTYGLSGLTVLLAGALYLLVLRNWRGTAGLLGGLAAVTLLAFVIRQPALPAPTTPLRIVQPNIGQQDRWREGFEEENFRRLARLTGRPAGPPRLVLWPESAVTDPLGDNRMLAAARIEALRQRVGRMIRPGDLLLTGGITLISPDGYAVNQATNSVFAMDASGQVLSRFDKAHLVPYGEYLPMRPILSAIGLSRLAPGDLDYIPGPGPVTLPLPLVGDVGFQLCYEIIFSGEVVDRANRPAFIFNPSNDAWFGRWGPPQHLAQARLRALEEGLPVLRSTPTGISAVVDAEGRLLHSLPWRQAGVIDTTLPAPLPPTPFARIGNIAPFLLALVLILIAVAVRRKAR